eukprot:TRINITY_DN734_c0_g1_i1.p1 TRINITY_DN734_c0_g1~~TRINITY_DN734_c0_g1_i1.p1  ORF type:complete len:302 (+),score=64.21 TRINITY_DN734_c0_g1_i1:109-906(+)
MKPISSKEFPASIFLIIKEEISTHKNKIHNVIEAEMRKANPPDNANIIRGIPCAECKKEIRKVAYLCTKCLHTYVVICQDCEARDIHPDHILLKAKNHEQLNTAVRSITLSKNPKKRSSSIFRSIAGFFGFFNIFDGPSPSVYPKKMGISLYKKERQIITKPGSIRFSYWELMNKSNKSWPDKIYIRTTGFDEPYNFIELPKPVVNPGETFKFWVPIAAPESKGEYSIDIAIIDRHNNEVGEEVNVKLIVKCTQNCRYILNLILT